MEVVFKFYAARYSGTERYSVQLTVWKLSGHRQIEINSSYNCSILSVSRLIDFLESKGVSVKEEYGAWHTIEVV